MREPVSRWCGTSAAPSSRLCAEFNKVPHSVRDLVLFFQSLPGFLGLFAAIIGIQDPLSDAVGLRRYLEQFIIGQVFDGLIQAHLPGRREPDLHIPARRTHIRQVLLPAHVDRNVAAAACLADNHAS